MACARKSIAISRIFAFCIISLFQVHILVAWGVVNPVAVPYQVIKINMPYQHAMPRYISIPSALLSVFQQEELV